MHRIGPEGVAVLIHHEVKFKVRSYSMYWPDGVAVLIHHEDRFTVRSYSTRAVSESDENRSRILRIVSEYHGLCLNPTK